MHPILTDALVQALVADRRRAVHGRRAAAGSSRPRVRGAPSRVDFDGGIGLEVANYGFASTGVHVFADLKAGDGRPGDDDRIRRSVESVLGSQFADVLAGSPRTEQLAGRDGDDQITGGSGEELVSGGRGNDRIDIDANNTGFPEPFVQDKEHRT